MDTIKALVIKPFGNTAFFVLLLMGLWLPLLGMIFEVGKSSGELEKRALTPTPTIQDLKNKGLKAYTLGIDRYFNDNFGFRESLISLHSKVAYYLFHTSTSSNVILGKNEFLFYKQAVDDYRTRTHFSPEALTVMDTTINKRRDWLQARGISYIFTVAPNKTSIYPEFLPYWVGKNDIKNRYDQLVELFQGARAPIFFDLRPALNEAKTARLIFHRTDTHWNDCGAFAAYTAIIEKVRTIYPHLPVLPLSAFELEEIPNFLGDLAGMLGGFPKMSIQTLRPRIPFRATLASVSSKRFINQIWAKEQPAPELPSVIIFGDSFFFSTAIKEYLAESFRRTVVVIVLSDYGAFDPELIEKEKPDLVIQETVERFLAQPFEANSF